MTLQIIETKFGRAELSDSEAMLFVDTGLESLGLNASVSDGELQVKFVSGEREIYEGSAHDLEPDHEFVTAAKRARAYAPLIDFLASHKSHPDIEAMLLFMRATPGRTN